MFCDAHELDDNMIGFVAVHISTNGSIKFYSERYDSVLADIAEENDWKQVWIYDRLTPPKEVADKSFVIRDKGVRVIPPISPTKRDWASAGGIHIIPEFYAYYASYNQHPSDEISKGIVVREIENAEPQDIKNIAIMCTDPAIRLGSATVIPAPYKHLREWLKINRNRLD